MKTIHELQKVPSTFIGSPAPFASIQKQQVGTESWDSCAVRGAWLPTWKVKGKSLQVSWMFRCSANTGEGKPTTGPTTSASWLLTLLSIIFAKKEILSTLQSPFKSNTCNIQTYIIYTVIFFRSTPLENTRIFKRKVPLMLARKKCGRRAAFP